MDAPLTATSYKELADEYRSLAVGFRAVYPQGHALADEYDAKAALLDAMVEPKYRWVFANPDGAEISREFATLDELRTAAERWVEQWGEELGVKSQVVFELVPRYRLTFPADAPPILTPLP